MEANTNLPGIGDRLANRYRIMFGRGSGPSGAVFKALDLENDLSVALKVFNPAFFDGPFAGLNITRLSRAPEIEDPNLVKVYDFVASEGRHFVTCQLVEGLSLRAVLDLHDEGGEHFPVTKLKGFGERMLNGVRAFHRKGIVHGNIKPENLFVMPDRLALSDPWYLVERRLREGEQIPVSDYYRAPEQLSDPAVEMFESDLYAIGLILGELIAISPVKPGLALSTQVPRLTKRFDDLFMTATAMNPEARYSSIDDFATCMREAFSAVQKEGLWIRRMHETGSFRAIRLPAGAERAAKVEPIDEISVKTIAPEDTPVPETSDATSNLDEQDLMDFPESDVGSGEETDLDKTDPLFEPQKAIETAKPEPPVAMTNNQNNESFKRTKGSKGGDIALNQTRPSKKQSQSYQPPPPDDYEKSKPGMSRGLIAVVVVILALLGVTAYLLADGFDNKPPEPQMAPIIKKIPVEKRTTPESGKEKAGAVPGAKTAEQKQAEKADTPDDKPEQKPEQAATKEKAAPKPEPKPKRKPEPKPEPATVPLFSLLKCGPDMALIVTNSKATNKSGKKPRDVAFCIDKHELSKGSKPLDGLSLSAAKRACRRAGKRVCSAKQWVTACGRGTPAASKCNTSGSRKKTGGMSGCVTKDGVYDMIGNMLELTSDRKLYGETACKSSGKHFRPQSMDGTRCCDAPGYRK